MTKPNILVFAGSLRTGSFNRRLAELAAKRLEGRGANVTRLDLRDYTLPIYEADVETAQGFPEAALKLHERLRTHQGVFIASPEYNANVSPLLINVLAWVSRITEHGGMAAAFGRPVYAISSASPGGFGGYRGLMALRNSLELQLQARVLPMMIPVALAAEAFDATDELVNPRSKHLLGQLVEQLVTESVKV